jgi:hypothetical protein
MIGPTNIITKMCSKKNLVFFIIINVYHHFHKKKKSLKYLSHIAREIYSSIRRGKHINS